MKSKTLQMDSKANYIYSAIKLDINSKINEWSDFITPKYNTIIIMGIVK